MTQGTSTPECPACAKSRTRPLTAVPPPAPGEEPLWIHACESCSHRFVPTTPEQQARIDRLYDAGYSGHRDDAFFNAAIRRQVERVLMPRRPPPARVLDVGCGNGEFLLAAAERGYHGEGIDISEPVVAHCRSRGLAARADDFLTAEYAEPFDVITFWDVVEHLRSPAEFLKRARRLLAPGGMVLIKTPGFNPRTYPLIRLYPRLANTALGTPGHIQLYTPRSLQTLLARCGLGRVEWLDTVNLHSRPPTRSLRRRLGRLSGKVVKHFAGNRNLYLWAGRADDPAAVRARAGYASASAAHPR
jgi:SAM-dependent methyltransferase